MTDHKEFIMTTLHELGWQVNFEKCELEPSKERTFVGFLLSTVGDQPWVKVMPKKITKLCKSIVRCLSKETVNVQQLARIIGQCVAMTKAIMSGKLLLRNCYRVLSTKCNWESELILTQAAKEDLKWWYEAIKSWNRAPLCQKAVDLQVETDASSFGWESYLIQYRTSASGSWNKEVSFRHSNFRELLAVYMTLLSFKEKIKNQHLQILSDNITTVAYINRMGGPNKDMSDLMITIWRLAQEHHVVLSARYLAGKLNQRADRLSCLKSK